MEFTILRNANKLNILKKHYFLLHYSKKKTKINWDPYLVYIGDKSIIEGSYVSKNRHN